jgi:hypothetical protein
MKSGKQVKKMDCRATTRADSPTALRVRKEKGISPHPSKTSAILPETMPLF